MESAACWSASVARSQMASSPMVFSAGRVARYAVYSNPKVFMKRSTSRQTPAISSASWSAVQKMWASSWVNPRTRSIPCTTPERS